MMDFYFTMKPLIKITNRVCRYWCYRDTRRKALIAAKAGASVFGIPNEVAILEFQKTGIIPKKIQMASDCFTVRNRAQSLYAHYMHRLEVRVDRINAKRAQANLREYLSVPSSDRPAFEKEETGGLYGYPEIFDCIESRFGFRVPVQCTKVAGTRGYEYVTGKPRVAARIVEKQEADSVQMDLLSLAA
jgi:glutaredoxin-related protein